MGRPAGSKNRHTFLFGAILQDLKISLPHEIFKVLREEDLKPKERADILLKLCEFVYPKPIAVQIPDIDDEEESSLQEEVDKETQEILDEFKKNGVI